MTTPIVLTGSHPTARNTRVNHFEPLRQVLDQLRRLVEQLDYEKYNIKPVTTYSGSLGGHVRHCLDHVNALLNGINGELVDYEARQRGGNVETDPQVAEAELARVAAELEALPAKAADQSVTVSVLLTSSGPALQAESNVAREVAFVLSHTIHHNAMIGGMAKAVGGVVPDDFGMAPGTIKHDRGAVAAKA